MTANVASKELEQFVDRLLEEKAMVDLDEEVLQQLKKDLFDRVEDRINAMLLAKLPADKLADFEKLLESGSDEEVQKFCSDAIPKLDEAIAAELLAFRTTYLS